MTPVPMKTRDIHIHRKRILLRTMKGINIGNFVQKKMLLSGFVLAPKHDIERVVDANAFYQTNALHGDTNKHVKDGNLIQMQTTKIRSD